MLSWELVCRIPEIVTPLHLSLLRPHSGMSLSSSPLLSFLPSSSVKSGRGGGRRIETWVFRRHWRDQVSCDLLRTLTKTHSPDFSRFPAMSMKISLLILNINFNRTNVQKLAWKRGKVGEFLVRNPAAAWDIGRIPTKEEGGRRKSGPMSHRQK